MSITMQDRVYFGTFWQLLNKAPAAPPIAVAGGFANATVQRTSEGDFFSGVVEKLDASGRVTDVIITFGGANGADAVQGEAILLGIPLDEAARAAALYDQVLADPRYADAKVHVTGHSLGAGYTQHVLAHAIATYGKAATDAKSDFIAFGAPNWGPQSARNHGLDPSIMEGRFVDYTAANDPVLINGVERSGTTYYLPAFWDTDSATDYALSAVSSHQPTTYASYLGLPGWLTAEQQTAALQTIDAGTNAASLGGGAWDPEYRPDPDLGLYVDGSEGADVLIGLAGDDVVRGGGGRDVMMGGEGADVFRFDRASDTGATAQTADRITDFRDGVDKIDLSRIDANILTLLWNEPFRLIEGGSYEPGDVRVYFAAGATWIAGNTDLDVTPEFLIRIDGRHDLGSADFLL